MAAFAKAADFAGTADRSCPGHRRTRPKEKLGFTGIALAPGTPALCIFEPPD